MSCTQYFFSYDKRYLASQAVSFLLLAVKLQPSQNGLSSRQDGLMSSRVRVRPLPGRGEGVSGAF